jgi:tRNA dimethylallyltransferase
MSAPAPHLRPPVVVVTGPTATGKTGLAIDLALRFDGEIVNADSMQVYRFMDIGTAKPSAEERARVPHHLIDVVAPDQPYSAGRYARAARAVIADLHARGRVPFLVGGTGLYIRAVLHGLVDGVEADTALREDLEAEQERADREGDPERLHRRLAASDPAAAARIHPHDKRRIVRALEIAAETGEPTSRIRTAHGFEDSPYRTLHLALDLPRQALYERIDRRCRAMIDAGLLQELRDLAEEGYGPQLRPMGAIGYRHVVPVMQGSDTLANALEAMCRDTRHFARRQLTWLRRVPDAIRVDPRRPEAIAARVAEFLAASDARAADGDAPGEPERRRAPAG